MHCALCSKEFSTANSLCKHIVKAHKLKTKEYYDKFLRTAGEGRCLTCGAPTNFQDFAHGYYKFCSHACSAKNSETRQKFKETMKETYGSESAMECKELYEKQRRTLKNNYNVDVPLKSEKIKKAYVDTSNKLYGTDHPMQNSTVKNKASSTISRKYNTDCTLKVPEFEEKANATKLLRYGTVNPSVIRSSADVKLKFENTCMKKYNCKNPMQNHTISNKVRDFRFTELEKKLKESTYASTISLLKRSGEGVVYFCKDCNSENSEDYHFFRNRLSYGINPCLKCNPISALSEGFSSAEKEVAAFIKSVYPGEVIENDRVKISPKELDIYIPEKSVAFEYDGLYFHSDLFKENSYHKDKTESCEKAGIRLYHIYEDEWLSKPEIVKSRIKDILHCGMKSVYARKCALRTELSNSEVYNFLEDNHLQGYVTGLYAYGLEYDGQLISLMTFGRSRFKKGEFELLRFCNKLGMSVTGGASKLLKHFRTDHPEIIHIVSYADRRWSFGDLYYKLGFKLESISGPSYAYAKKDSMKRINRMNFQKYKLVEAGADAGKSEREITSAQGYARIYDCGQYRFIL